VTTPDDDSGDRAPGDAAPDLPDEELVARAEAEERAWREIVDHYGERPDVEELGDPAADNDPRSARSVEFRVSFPVLNSNEDWDDEDDEPFVPPPLPPPAVISPERRLAWVGLVASPLLMIVFQLIAYPLPGIIDFGLLIAFLASFGYLVATMSPRDPDDDGARV
jgi:hypothetical protein